MARAYLIIIIIGAIVGMMLPSGAPSGPRHAADIAQRDASGRENDVRLVSSRRLDRFASAEPSTSAVAGQGTTLDRAPDGHFYADAQVNGTPVRFLVDTGASGVALSADDARRAGLPFFSTEFSPVGRGASGEVRGKIVTLDRVTLGGKTVENVSGAILEGSELSLLGQSFLGRMGSIEISGDKMVIR